MTNEKFEEEINTLEKFFTTFCCDKHQKQYENIHILEYKNRKYEIKTELCQECQQLLDYSYQRLLQCPHEIKPRCRKCSNPCYEKDKWKSVAKLMKYSGVKFGLIQIKKLLKFK